MDNNIHEVEFGNSTLTQIEQLYQYDKGQILKITDKVEDGTEVQFSNNNSEITINKAINDSQVEIPDILLQENRRITAYLKIINKDSETTIKTVIIPVKARTKPADYIEPEQEKPFRKYVEELKTAAEQSASDASTSEQNASQSEQNASTSEQNAKKSEQNASKSATDASTSASNAKKSETAAATSEQNARKITEQLTEDVSQLKESIVDLSDIKKEEISQKGLEVLQSIPADYSALSDATLIKPTVQGTNMVLTDSSDMNIQELHIYGKTEQRTTTGKNLFDTNTIFSTFIADGRATVTDEGVLLNGTFGATNRNFNITLKKGTYYISGGGILHILAPGDSTFDKKIVVEDEEKTFQCYIASGTYTNKLIQPQIEIGSVATDYEPYTGSIASPNPEYPQDIDSVENPTVSVAGKNLYSFNMNGVPKETTRNGIKYIKNQDGSLKIKGTATAASKYEVITLNKSPQIFKNSTIGKKFTFKIFGLPETCYWEMSYTGNVYGEKSRTFVNIEKYANKKYTVLAIPEGVTVDTTIYPILVLGDSILEYEHCKEIQTATLNYELNGIDDVKDELIIRADGTGQLIQRLLEEELNDNSNYVLWYANTNTYGFLMKESKWLFRANKINIKSNKLKGITKEVGNPGTYDKNGIFVDAAGLYIKISKKYLTEYTVDAFKTYLRDNPITVVGLLKEPIVTELSSEEVQKILAIHTNKPNSTIWNDQNADMQITYVADAKNYIDNKFTELSDAIIASASEAE